ncbi:hypothetical protein PPERSA_08279 [Pseudocohnilembus persalinus]|uniref:Uncharacterized protein n=1 Tax=Pseudocohnilembus persalinus TaxID=266149 RepID=A0A0V0Q7U7_PSEPJ|nr:hypothetical protein PPERSA_08279 [Pseudocohnilembus persalinus]|eukprot:KRW98116.1 hypothetical protein PPERSA_08279 [Pseudocohnilembus persalinus]
MKKLIEQIFQKSQPEIIQEELVLLAEQNPFMIEILQELKNSSERIVSQQIHKQMEFFNSIKMDESQPLVGMRQQIGGKIKYKIINHEQVQKNLQNFNDNLIKNKDLNQFLQTVKKDNHNLRGNFNKALNYFNQKKDKILNYDLEDITDVKLGQSTYYFHQIIKILDSTLNEIDKKQIDNGIISNCEERVTSKLSEQSKLSVNREILQPNKNYEQMTSTSNFQKFSLIDLKNRKNSRYNSSTVNSNNILTSTYSNSNKQLLVPNEKMGQLIDIPVQYKSSNDNLLHYNQNLDSFQSNLPNKKQNGQSNNEKSQFSPKITNSMSYQFNYNDHKNSDKNNNFKQQNQHFSNKNLDDNIQTSNLSFQSPLQNKQKNNNSSNINVNISINNNQTNIQKQENNYNLFYKNQKKSSNNNKNNKNNIGSSKIISGQNLDNLEEEEDIEIEQDSSVEIPPKN